MQIYSFADKGGKNIVDSVASPKSLLLLRNNNETAIHWRLFITASEVVLKKYYFKKMVSMKEFPLVSGGRSFLQNAGELFPRKS